MSRLPSQAAINERCLELGKNKSKTTVLDEDHRPTKKAKNCGCPYNKTSNIQMLRDTAVVGIHDIEELVSEGKKTASCPYYAARQGGEVVLAGNQLYDLDCHRHG